MFSYLKIRKGNATSMSIIICSRTVYSQANTPSAAIFQLIEEIKSIVILNTILLYFFLQLYEFLRYNLLVLESIKNTLITFD